MRKQLVTALLILPLLLGCGSPSSGDSAQVSVAESTRRVISPSALLQHADWERIISGVTLQLAEHVAQDDVGGIAVGVVADGQLIWADGFGWADRTDSVPMTPDAVFRTGSASKTVTAMVLMRLVDKGVVSLDEPVSLYLPEFGAVRERNPSDPEVTFRHLASHTAGLERNYREGLAGEIEQWKERVVQSLSEMAFASEPGTQYQDSPIGYGALGLALERAARKPFVELVQEEVLGPLGMTGTSYTVEGTALEARLATAYPNKNGGTIADGSGRGRVGGGGYTLPAGGMFSTVGDLGLLLSAAAGEGEKSIFTDSSRRELISAQTPGGLNPSRGPGYPRNGPRPAVFRDGHGGALRSPEVLDAPYGLGFSLHLDRDGHLIAHAGGIAAGYTAYMAVDPETRIGVVMLRNYWRGATDLGDGSLELVSQLNRLVAERPSWLGSRSTSVVLALSALVVLVLFNMLIWPAPKPRRPRRGSRIDHSFRRDA